MARMTKQSLIDWQTSTGLSLSSLQWDAEGDCSIGTCDVSGKQSEVIECSIQDEQGNVHPIDVCRFLLVGPIANFLD